MSSLLSQLQPKEGSVFSKKRVGRGHSTGQGGTAGKGHKGQKARAGGRVRWGFEGGQTPLMRRLPKFGFNNHNFRDNYTVINLKDLEIYAQDKVVAPENIFGRNSKGILLKVLGSGTVSGSYTVKAHKFSEKAKKEIEAAGGRVEVIE